MKIYVPFETVAKSLFVAKDKTSNELKLVFFTPIKGKPSFFVYQTIIFDTEPLNEEQLANLNLYSVDPFLNRLFDLIHASKDFDKLALSRLQDLMTQAELQEKKRFYTFDEVLAEVKVEREISRGRNLFLNDFEDLIKNNDVQPISYKSVISNVDKYQIALSWAFLIKDMEHCIVRRINDFVLAFLYSMANEQRTNEFAFDFDIIEHPRKAKLLLRLNTFEKIKLYFGALL